MARYRIWRRLSSYPPDAWVKIDSVAHPDTSYIDYGVEVGTLDTAFYKVTAVDLALNVSGFSNTVWIQTNATSNPAPSPEVTLQHETIPHNFALEGNYPNPFNPLTIIRYSLPLDSRVTLKLYDALGREISTLVDGEERAGWHEVHLDAAKLSSGIYFYRL